MIVYLGNCFFRFTQEPISGARCISLRSITSSHWLALSARCALSCRSAWRRVWTYVFWYLYLCFYAYLYFCVCLYVWRLMFVREWYVAPVLIFSLPHIYICRVSFKLWWRICIWRYEIAFWLIIYTCRVKCRSAYGAQNPYGRRKRTFPARKMLSGNLGQFDTWPALKTLW